MAKEAAAKRERRAPARRRGSAPRSGSAPDDPVDPQAPFAYPAGLLPPGSAALALDPLVHDRTRLGMLSALAVNAALGFTELKRLLNVSDGNLSIHARKLEQALLVTCTKSFAGRVPRTEFRITPLGRRALESYLRHMEALIEATRR